MQAPINYLKGLREGDILPPKLDSQDNLLDGKRNEFLRTVKWVSPCSTVNFNNCRNPTVILIHKTVDNFMKGLSFRL